MTTTWITMLQCVDCKTKRDITFVEASLGQPMGFQNCPKCGMPEVAISATTSNIPRRQPMPHPAGVGPTAKQAKE